MTVKTSYVGTSIDIKLVQSIANIKGNSRREVASDKVRKVRQWENAD